MAQTNLFCRTYPFFETILMSPDESMTKLSLLSLQKGTLKLEIIKQTHRPTGRQTHTHTHTHTQTHSEMFTILKTVWGQKFGHCWCVKLHTDHAVERAFWEHVTVGHAWQQHRHTPAEFWFSRNLSTASQPWPFIRRTGGSHFQLNLIEYNANHRLWRCYYSHNMQRWLTGAWDWDYVQMHCVGTRWLLN